LAGFSFQQVASLHNASFFRKKPRYVMTVIQPDFRGIIAMSVGVTENLSNSIENLSKSTRVAVVSVKVNPFQYAASSSGARQS
jgi:hypothetical protein